VADTALLLTSSLAGLMRYRLRCHLEFIGRANHDSRRRCAQPEPSPPPGPGAHLPLWRRVWISRWGP